MISEKIENSLKKSSWIRAMFEEGEKLRQQFGENNVFDFTLGNPDPEPPIKVRETLYRLLENDKGLHKYMNNAGFADVRQKVAEYVKKDSGLSVVKDNIVMCVGAAGGLNVTLKTILDPNDEVIIFAPYFAEYLFYIDNHGGKTVVVPPDLKTFYPDLAFFRNSITKKTKAIIINSPNNPSGVVYSKNVLIEMASILHDKETEYGTSICVISDEPYVGLAYDNVEVPNILPIFKHAVIVSSFSKSLSLAGERIGYIVASPKIHNVNLFMNGLIFTNRILGFVNAPAMFQKVVAELLEEKVDIEVYRERRDLLYHNLVDFGYKCVKPEGAFYLFVKSPLADDIQFIKHAVKYNLLLVPGTGFGMPGYFRISYCVGLDTIQNALPVFEKVIRELEL